VFATNLETIKHLLPELILVLCGAWLFVGGTWRAERWFWTAFSLASYAIAALALFRQAYGMEVIAVETGTIHVSSFGNAIRWLALACGVLFSLLGVNGSRKGLNTEFLGGVMMIVVGLMVTARANDLVLLFAGVELVSIPTYMLLFLARRDRSAAEAAGKYFFLSILASAVLLYGFSFLYGVSGTTLICGDREVAGIREKLAALLAQGGKAEWTYLLAPALVFILAGLGFKLAAVPFHFYAPDVYQGTTSSNAAILAVAPKIAGLSALLKISVVVAPNLPAEFNFGWQLMVVVAALTMSIGNMCALWQTNIRRLLAYSSIAHSGYMLIGVAVVMAGDAEAGNTMGGAASSILYLAMYTFTSIGAFSIITFWRGTDQEVNSIEELAGGAQSRPLAAAALAVFMFSFAGIPPLAGFWGKFALFRNAVTMAISPEDHTKQTWFAVLAVIAAINAAIGAAYYLRIVSNLYFKKSTETAVAAPLWQRPAFASAMVCLVVVLGLGFYSRPIVRLAGDAEQSLYLQPDTTMSATTTNPNVAATEGEANR
jgi:NADH-quinone oxidoreductase subunit N